MKKSCYANEGDEGIKKRWVGVQEEREEEREELCCRIRGEG